MHWHLITGGCWNRSFILRQREDCEHGMVTWIVNFAQIGTVEPALLHDAYIRCPPETWKTPVRWTTCPTFCFSGGNVEGLSILQGRRRPRLVPQANMHLKRLPRQVVTSSTDDKL
jgi:hypothetical protein